ncbi:hypothetical protein [Pseudomonas sp. NPDC085632]|uniref:hypothetical protein n=1 Tax=Pseudomonas sp. NPDC085632 TaxID=3364429 RepID=UPI0037C6A78E
MLILRTEQMDAFSQRMLTSFENEMLANSQQYYPELCENVGEHQLRLFVRSAMERAGNFGLSARGPVRLFIEMSLLCGSSFDTDPQYPWAGAILRNGKPQMERADALYWAIVDYQKHLPPPDGTRLGASLKQAQMQMLTSFGTDLEQGTSCLSTAIRHVWPEKVAYVGTSNLNVLIRAMLNTARTRSIVDADAHLLLLTLMLVCGHGCFDDPLYPWLSKALCPAALQDAALTWFDDVLSAQLAG